MSRLFAFLRKHWLGTITTIVVAGVIIALVARMATNDGNATSANKPGASASSTAGEFQQLGAANLGVSASGQLPKGMTAVAAPNIGKPAFSSLAQQISPTVHITPDGALPHTITLRFRLSQKVSSTSTVVIATRETPTGPWSLIRPTISANGQYVTFAVDQLSWLSSWLLDVKSSLSTFKNDIQAVLSGGLTDKPSPPSCQQDYFGSHAPHDDFGVESPTNKSTVYWCFGIENGKHVLKVVNRERYPLNVTHTGFTVLSAGHIQAEFRQLARLGSGSTTILYPHDEADFAVNTLSPGQNVRVSTSYSGWADSLYRFDVSFQALMEIMTKFGIGDDIGIHTPKYFDLMDKMLAGSDCFNAVSNRNFGQMLVKCFKGEALADPFGEIGSFILFGIVDAIGSLTNWFISQFQVLTSSVNHDDEYTITVGRSSAAIKPTGEFADYAGSWTKHESTFTVKPDGSAVLVYRDYTCDIGPGGVNLAKCFITVNWQLSPEDGHMLALETSDPRIAVGLSKKSADVLIMHADPGILKSYQGDLPYCRADSAAAKDGTQCG